MMDKKSKVGSIVSNAGKAAKNLLDNAIQAVDQNEDGKFDFVDVSTFAESVGTTVKNSASAVKESAEEKARELERKLLQPIFPDSLDCADFLMPKFVRIVERDKKYAESEVCQGSIGYGSDQKGLHMVNIFRDSVEAFGLMFYPDQGCEFYYADPSERNSYIALDEYFGYLKMARVNELKKIAQDLGAKHFKVTYREEQTSFSERKVKVRSKMADVGTVDGDSELTQKKYATVDVEAEMIFPGHLPIKPRLKYLQ